MSRAETARGEIQHVSNSRKEGLRIVRVFG
jgi:hypothetical protein